MIQLEVWLHYLIKVLKMLVNIQHILTEEVMQVAFTMLILNQGPIEEQFK